MAFGIPGTEMLDSIDIGSILGGIGMFLAAVFIFIVIGGSTYWFFERKKKQKANKKLFWFEEVNGSMVPVDEDTAVELTIPGTNITVFYIKKKDMYMPRPVKRMGKDSYWLCIKNNREIVNFTMKNLNEEMTEANLDFDHTDMRYAHSNLRELIQRNYRDNSKPWWREYKEVISLVILIFVLSLSFFFIISKTGALIDKASVLIEVGNQYMNSACVKGVGSGVVAA